MLFDLGIIEDLEIGHFYLLAGRKTFRSRMGHRHLAFRLNLLYDFIFNVKPLTHVDYNSMKLII